MLQATLSTPIEYENNVYKQIITEDLRENDLVLNTEYTNIGRVDYVHDKEYVAVRWGWAVQLGVPKTQLIKLIPNTSNL